LELREIETEVGRERVQPAVVFLSGGRYSSVERQVALPEAAWRDVLVAACLTDEDWQPWLKEQLDHGGAS
jgi:hypothetical protein